MYDSLRNEIERLYAEITITEQKLGAVGDDTKQHDGFWRDLLTTDQLLLKNKEQRLELTLQKGESMLTRVELAAQQLVAQTHSNPSSDPRP